jgi:hypothetical protein
VVTLNGFQVHKTADCQPLLAWPSGLHVYGCQVLMSAAGPISTELGLSGHVRSTPDSDRIADVPDRQLRANMQHHILCLEMKEAAN